jgi:hypothetical protein
MERYFGEAVGFDYAPMYEHDYGGPGYGSGNTHILNQ